MSVKVAGQGLSRPENTHSLPAIVLVAEPKQHQTGISGGALGLWFGCFAHLGRLGLVLGDSARHVDLVPDARNEYVSEHSGQMRIECKAKRTTECFRLDVIQREVDV